MQEHRLSTEASDATLGSCTGSVLAAQSLLATGAGHGVYLPLLLSLHRWAPSASCRAPRARRCCGPCWRGSAARGSRLTRVLVLFVLRLRARARRDNEWRTCASAVCATNIAGIDGCAGSGLTAGQVALWRRIGRHA